MTVKGTKNLSRVDIPTLFLTEMLKEIGRILKRHTVPTNSEKILLLFHIQLLSIYSQLSGLTWFVVSLHS